MLQPLTNGLSISNVGLGKDIFVKFSVVSGLASGSGKR